MPDGRRRWEGRRGGGYDGVNYRCCPHCHQHDEITGKTHLGHVMPLSANGSQAHKPLVNLGLSLSLFRTKTEFVWWDWGYLDVTVRSSFPPLHGYAVLVLPVLY